MGLNLRMNAASCLSASPLAVDAFIGLSRSVRQVRVFYFFTCSARKSVRTLEKAASKCSVGRCTSMADRDDHLRPGVR
jgi:hypothetical protein